MDRQTLRGRLEKRRQMLQNSVDQLYAEGFNMSETYATGELSSYDNHSGDMASETFEREKDIGLLGTAVTELREVNEALDRLDHGRYGWCEACGKAISEDRLEAIPWTRTCIGCAEAAPQGQTGRAMEEEIISPPWGWAMRHPHGQTGFDGEDTWQSLASWGNSNSPQDTPPVPDDYEHIYINHDERHGATEDVELDVDEEGDSLV